MTIEHTIHTGISGTVDVYALARTSGQIVGAMPIVQMQRLMPILAEPSGRVAFDFRGLIDSKGRPAAELRIEARLRLYCDRCAEPVDVITGETGKFYFVPDQQALEAVPIEDVDEEPLIGSERFDLADLVEDQVILSLPMTPRHAVCDPIRAEADDLATEEPRANPFAVLASLKRRPN